MTENKTECRKNSVHDLIPFLIPFCLALVGNADALFIASTEWGKAHGDILMSGSLASWALVAFLMYRELTREKARWSVAVRFSCVCAFALFTGALCALDTLSGFVFFEALIGAGIVASCCIEMIGVSFLRVPHRVVCMAGCQAAGIMVGLMISDLYVSAAAALSAFVLTLLLFFSGPERESTDRIE